MLDVRRINETAKLEVDLDKDTLEALRNMQVLRCPGAGRYGLDIVLDTEWKQDRLRKLLQLLKDAIC